MLGAAALLLRRLFCSVMVVLCGASAVSWCSTAVVVLLRLHAASSGLPHTKCWVMR
jgi:hypothetical protein